MTDRDATGRSARLVSLAWATPLVVAACVLEPRIATNRPSYGFREAMILLTAALSVPCVFAIGRLRSRQAASASRSTTARRWLWSAVTAFAALPVALSVAGQVAPVPGSYGDDQIPGLAAGLLSATAAIILAAATLCWMALGRLATRKAQPTPDG